LWFSRRPAKLAAHLVERRAVRLGYEVVGRSWICTTRVPRPRVPRARHSVENQWDLLSALDIPLPDAAKFPVEMSPDPHVVEAVSERLARAGVDANNRVIVVHVSAGNPFRRWPAAAFVYLVTALVARDRRRRVIVTSGPSGTRPPGVIDQARLQLDPADREHVLSCGEFSLAELRALVDRSALFIGGDSGPLHVAATSTVPIVGLYGPTLPVRSAPWRNAQWITESVEVDGLECRPCDQRTCTPGDFRCLTWLRPEQVIDAAERTLARAAVKNV
jgi:ADP-heptose:LPS heptosyltransferase